MILSFFKKDKKVFCGTTKEIAEDFSDSSELLNYFKTHTGIDFENKKFIITSKLKNYCLSRGFYSFSSFLDNIKVDAVLRQELINYLSVNETYFFREYQQIKELVALIKNSKEKKRILTLPSSTGEETYSIALSLVDEGLNHDNFEIVGADINSKVVTTAKKAIYKQRSLHRVPKDTVDKYFQKTDQNYKLKDEIKSLVDFKVVNLFDDSFFALGRFDYIFCRNLFIYFDAKTKKEAKDRLNKQLKDGGKLFFGHADV